MKRSFDYNYDDTEYFLNSEKKQKLSPKEILDDLPESDDSQEEDK